MICHCGATALYQVGAKGFCRAHYADGVAAQKKTMIARQVAGIRRQIENDRGRSPRGTTPKGGASPKAYLQRPRHITPEQEKWIRLGIAGAAARRKAAAKRQPPPTSGASQ